MENFLTRSKAEELKKTVAEKPYYNFGEIHPHKFSQWDDDYAKTGLINILITHVGKFELDRNLFESLTCPVCGEKTLVVYDLCASVLSGAHVLRGFCTNCNEYIAFEDRQFYKTVREYIRENFK